MRALSPTLRSLKPPCYYGKDIGWWASWIASTTSKQSLQNEAGVPPSLLRREWKGAALVAVSTMFWRTVRRELDWCHEIPMKRLLSSSQQPKKGWKAIWYSVSWCHSLCPVKNRLRKPVLVCIAYLWFPKNHAPGGNKWSTACLTIFPPYNQCASCVRGSREGGTRAGLHQLHIAWRDVDGFHFLCAECKERRTRQINCPDTLTVAVQHVLNVSTVG